MAASLKKKNVQKLMYNPQFCTKSDKSTRSERKDRSIKSGPGSGRNRSGGPGSCGEEGVPPSNCRAGAVGAKCATARCCRPVVAVEIKWQCSFLCRPHRLAVAVGKGRSFHHDNCDDNTHITSTGLGLKVLKNQSVTHRFGGQREGEFLFVTVGNFRVLRVVCDERDSLKFVLFF